MKGLTAKHAAGLVKVANAYKSDITIEAENKKINAKSLMGVISLGLQTMQKITVKADGADEAAAAEALISFLKDSL